MSSATTTALNGLGTAQAYYNTAVQRETAASLSTQPSDDLVSSVVQTTTAAEAVKVNAAALRSTLDTERSLIDVFA